MKSFLAAVVLMGSFTAGMTGCLHRAESALYVNMLIDPSDLKGDIVIKKCDRKGAPRNCRTLSYECKHPGCERVQVSAE
jgi:hypothetical protein